MGTFKGMKYEDLTARSKQDYAPVNDAINKTLLKLKLAELKNRAKAYANMSDNDSKLFGALDLCLDAPSKLASENEKITKAKAKLIKEQPEDPKTKIRVNYLEYNKWALEQIAKRAAKEAFRRKNHLFDLHKSPEKQQEEMRKCAEDIMYWFENYAWIVDPRNTILYAFPFELFEFQKESVEWIDDLIYTLRSDGLIDKSRDMGVTWLIVCMFVYYWLFPREGTKFEALITSYRADEVDKKNVSSTIFEKIRSQIRFLPSWMLPKEFDPKRDMTYMTIINPENGSTITGTTANAETGRSGRFTVIFFDEMASIEQDVSSATASTGSTNTRLYVSTPKGKLNYFAQMRFAGDIPVRSFHWTRHPFKDERWYAGQKLKMSPEMVAQELDIDYDASQPGKVFPDYSEVYHVITKSDFMREVEGSIAIENGVRRFRIPLEWHLGRSHDWGSSDSGGEHANITMWFATAKMGTKTKTHGIDISGSVFVYRMHTAAPHSTVRQVSKKVHELQLPDNEQSRMVEELMSHEALSERDTYDQEHDLHYTAWNTDYNAGIAQARDYLEVQNYHLPHPFRVPTEIPGAPAVKGRPSIFIIVDDDQGECYFDRMTNKWQVRPGRDDNGMARLRAEFGVYHYPKSETGKPVRKQRPEKVFDDAMDCFRCMAVTFPPVAQFNQSERLEMSLPSNLRTDYAMQETNMEERGRIWMSRYFYINENRLIEKTKNDGLGYGRRSSVLRRARSKVR